MATTSKLPSTSTYRVSIRGAIYDRFVETTGDDGQPALVKVRDLALFGQEIELTASEAHRLKELGAVKPKDAPLTYDEMDDSQLDKAVAERGIAVTSTGAEEDQPLRTDKINALVIYDQGQGGAGQSPVPVPPAA